MITALIASILALVGLTEATAAHDLLALRRDMRRAGQLVYVATTTDGTRLGARRCGALGRATNIVRVGTLTETGIAHAVKSPGDPIVLYTYVGDTPAIISGLPELPGALLDGNMYVSSIVASELGVGAGQSIDLGTDGSAVVARVADWSARAPSLSLAALAPSADVTVDECWVEVTAAGGIEDEIAQVLGTDVNVRRALPAASFVVDPDVMLRSRPERSRTWLIGAGGAILLLVTVIWFRRREGALYRALGSGRAGAALIFVTELAVVVGTATAWSALATRMFVDGRTAQLLAVLAVLRAGACTLLGAALLAAAVQMFGSVVQRLKEQ